MNSNMTNRILYSIVFFISVEVVFVSVFVVRYFCYKTLFSKTDKVLFIIGTILFFIISIYLNF